MIEKINGEESKSKAKGVKYFWENEGRSWKDKFLCRLLPHEHGKKRIWSVQHQA